MELLLHVSFEFWLSFGFLLVLVVVQIVSRTILYNHNQQSTLLLHPEKYVLRFWSFSRSNVVATECFQTKRIYIFIPA